MAELIRNVCVAGEWFGPAYGNATNVPADVAAKITNPIAWDTPPAHEADESAPSAPAEAAPAPQDPETPTFDQGGVLRPGWNAVRNDNPDAEPITPADILDGLDLDDLRAVATDEGIRVDKRWGEDRLRSTIRQRRADQ